MTRWSGGYSLTTNGEVDQAEFDYAAQIFNLCGDEATEPEPLQAKSEDAQMLLFGKERKTMRKYRINTYNRGVFYRYAKTAAAARQRVVYAIFGRGYEGWEHEYWTVEEVEAG